MNRQLTTLFAALEALLVAGVGIGVCLVPLTLMWAIEYGLQIDWAVFWRASVDIWLIGHGTDLRAALDAQVAADSGIAGAGGPFTLTIAPLGFAVLTVALGIRAGRRIGETDYRDLGLAVALVVFAGIAFLLTLSVSRPMAAPSLAQGALLPTLVFAVALAVGAARAARARRLLGRPASGSRLDDALARATTAIDERMPGIRHAARAVASGGVAAVALVVAVGALAVALLLALSYGQVISLYQAAQSGALGGAALTLGQLAFVPNLVIWAAAWFIGPGFAIGSGSSISPIGTAVGPLPAVPLLGALPTGALSYGFVGILVPVLAGFAVGLVLRARLERAGLDRRRELAVAGAGVGLVAGIVFAALAAAASGSAGPGRLAEVGASWVAVGGFSALEIAAGAIIALLVAGMRRGERADESEQLGRAAGVDSDSPDVHVTPAGPTTSVRVTPAGATTGPPAGPFTPRSPGERDSPR